MKWGGNYGAVEDVWSEPYLVLEGDEHVQLREAKSQWDADVLRNTQPADRPAAEAAIDELYAIAGLRRPRHVWLGGPEGRTRKSLWSGAHDPAALGGWLMFCHFDLSVVFNPPSGHVDRSKECAQHWERRLELWAQLGRACGGWMPFERECRFIERPKELHLKPGTTFLHRADGPALRYADGTRVYAWNGHRVKASFVAGHLTWKDWRGINDLRERNAFIDRMGWSWLLEHCPNAAILTRDSEKIVWLLRGEDLGPLVFNFGSGCRMRDLKLVERFGDAKRNVAPDIGEALRAGAIELQVSDDW
jgi:hypothetical protein